MRSIRWFGVAALIAMLVSLFTAPTRTQAASVVLVPSSYTTTNGSDGGQPVANLQVKDQSGSQNNWNKYIEFLTPGSASYAGYRSYTVPNTVSPASVTAIQVQANFLGPAPSDQTWTWQIYNWSTSAWVTLGTNTGASWSSWKSLTFNASGSFSSYISGSNEIRIGLISNNTSDDADLDYEAVTLTTIDGPTATPSTSPASPTLTSTSTALPSSPTSTSTAVPSGPTNTPTAAPSGPVYYVATTGNDSNPGTLAAPWKTIQKAASSLTAGSTAYVRGGVYKEQVNFTVSGSAGNPITVQNYPGEQPIIDGIDMNPEAIAASTGNESVALVSFVNRNYIIFKGFEIRNLIEDARWIVPIGISLSGSGTGIELRNNIIHTIETRYNGLDGGDAHGISVYGTASTAISGLVIDSNELYNLKLGSSEALVINGNVNGFAVTKNLVHDANNIGIDAIGYEGVGPSGSDRARNGIIADNRVWKIDSSTNPAYGATCSGGVCSGGDTGADGIYVDGGTDIIIERNLVADANIGIELASEHSGKSTDYITVRNNIVWNVHYAGIAIGGYSSSSSGSGGGSATNNKIVNNTVYTHSQGAAFVVQYRVTSNIIRNNIFSASSGNQILYESNQSQFLANNTVGNNLSLTSTNSALNPSNTFVSVTRPSDSDLRLANPTSVQQFLHINSGSGAHNAGGSSADSGSSDIDGHTRVQGSAIDIGADEIP